ncbi:hypothetical protein EDE15_4917 [Edaphobacter aggregans]|uniref:Uncharacterized protein n=1 Tax=Edaphobacter aggregans TaxID=570835 RepID=A0A3R9P0P5_9BACT|nr:hypothetical protein EDE15_4917 [Edaphobacter aggregans]
MPLRQNGNILSARPIESIVHRLRDPDWNIPVKLSQRALADRVRGPDELARERAAISESQELARSASKLQQSDIWKATETAVQAMKRSETEAARVALDEILRNILRTRTDKQILPGGSPCPARAVSVSAKVARSTLAMHNQLFQKLL